MARKFDSDKSGLLERHGSCASRALRNAGFTTPKLVAGAGAREILKVSMLGASAQVFRLVAISAFKRVAVGL